MFSTQPADVSTYYETLKMLLEAVQAQNQDWLNQLKDKLPDNLEAQLKIETLKSLDAVIVSSVTSHTPTAINEEVLKRLVGEIKDYKTITNRYFSDLQHLSEIEPELVVQARQDLFAELSEVEQYLKTEIKGDISLLTEPEKEQYLLIRAAQPKDCKNLFLQTLKHCNFNGNSKEYKNTQALFQDKELSLEQNAVDKLTTAWQQVVEAQIKKANSLQQRIKIIGELLCIYTCLETLYGRLATNVSIISST